MPFDGFGNFLRLYSWVVDATNSVKIRADRHDDEDNNFMAGLSQCITKDGQTAVTQNIPLNSRRLVSVADPIDPQDAATKHYADTKMPLDGSAPITGDVIVKNADPSITLDGTAGTKNSIIGQKADKNRWEIVLGNATAESTGDAGSDFELINYHDNGTLIGDVLFGTRSTGLLTVKANPAAALGVATKQYVDTTSTTASTGKVNRAGDTMTGALNSAGSGGGINAGALSTGFNVINTPGVSHAYMSFYAGGFFGLNFGCASDGNLYMGGISHGNTTYKIWTTRDFTTVPGVGTIKGVQLAMAGDVYVSGEIGSGAIPEAFYGAVMTGFGANLLAYRARFRYLQVQTTSWFTVSYA